MAWDFFVRHYASPAQQACDPKLTKKGIFYPRAGTLGGCTSHNAMITMWPPDSDWDAIAALTGDPGWGAPAMRRYVARVEQCRYRPVWRFLSRFGLNPTGHGWHGWLPTEKALPPQVWGDLRLIWTLLLEAAGLGLEEPNLLLQLWRLVQGRADPNDRRILGAGSAGLCFAPLSTDRGRRFGTRERLRAVAQSRPAQLRIELHALVTDIVMDDNRRAVGVRYLKGERLYGASPGAAAGASDQRTALCTGEVILAGGTFNTPQLLMLSGIGDPAELSRHGIPTRIPLAGVGRNLQDRYEVAVVSRMAKDWRVLAGAEFRRGDKLYREWERKREGMYVSNGASLAFTARSAPELAVPDLFCMGLLARFAGYYPGYSEQIRAHHDYLSWTILKAHTENRGGTVRLRSPYAWDVPEIDFNYFEGKNEADLQALVSAVKRVRIVLRPLIERGLAREEQPGPDMRTDAEIAQWARDTAWGHHASGTAAIGPAESGGVLDRSLRVHGTAALRVVDASIFPRIPGLFITGAIYLAAERAADIVLEAARSKADVG